jgi:hypothetical protein
MNNKILAIGRYNSFLTRSISELSNYGNLDAIILIKEENIVIPLNIKNIKTFNIINFRGIIKFYYYIYKNRNKYDAFIFYYLQEYFYVLLNLNIIKGPKFYFPYGSDLHRKGILKFIVKNTLKKFQKIFIELETQKRFIIEDYKIPKDRVETSFIIFNVDSCFRLIDAKQKVVLKEKWKIKRRYVIVSPRSLTEHYNHHLVIEGLGNLDDKFKKNIQLIIIGLSNKKYIQHLKIIGKRLNIEILHLKKYITPREMSEIFNISDININIPKHDQFGHSIIEGCLCGSVPLLSNKIGNYHELMKENINCIYTNETHHDIAIKIAHIIKNYNSIKEICFLNNINRLSLFTKKKENSEKVMKYIYDFIKNN